MGLWRSPLGRAGLFGTAAATVVNLLIYAVGSLADVDWDVGDNDPNALAVALTTIFAGVAATIFAIVLLRYLRLRRSLLVFMVVGSIAAVASLVTPFDSDAETTTKWVLASMHVVAGVVILGWLGHELNAAQKRIAGSS